MELEIIKNFLVVAREENITKAALILHITQPSLSRQIKKLEEEMGIKLFIKDGRSFVLTEKGKLFKERALEIVSLFEKTRRELTRGEGKISGEISVGSGELWAFDYLAVIIEKFHKTNPRVTFNIISDAADRIKELLEKGQIDFGLLMEPVEISRYEFLRIPGKEIWGALVRLDSNLAQNSEITPNDLIDLPLIVSKRTLVQNELVVWAGESYPDNLNIVATYNLLNNAAAMVDKNMGVALCLNLAAHYENLRFIPLYPELTTRSILVWKKDHTLSHASKLFLELTKRYIKSIDHHTK